MELKNIFKMTKADRYTQDGRDQIAKLQETEDVTYKTGDISQKTGLQKQPDGSWAPPKKGANKSAGNKPDAKELQRKLWNAGYKFNVEPSQGLGWESKGNYSIGSVTSPEGKKMSMEEAAAELEAKSKPAAESKPASYKEGSVIENAKDQYKVFLNKQVEYQKAYHEENSAHPKEPTERQDVLASLVKNASDQRQMFQAIDDMNRGTGGWKINKQTANKLKDLQKEQKALEAKLEECLRLVHRPGQKPRPATISLSAVRPLWLEPTVHPAARLL